MPPIDPNDRPIFLDPEERGQGPTVYTGMSQEPISAPAFTQQDVDLAAALRPHIETLTSLTTQMAQNFEGINTLLQSNATHLDNIGRKQRQNTRYSADEYDRQRKIRDLGVERAKIMDRINAAEQKSSDALLTQFRMGGMLRQGQIEYLDENGKLATTTMEQYRQMSDAQRRGIREQLASNIQQQGGQDTRFELSQALQHLAHGNIGSAVGELLQGIPGTQRLTTRLQLAGEARMATGTAQIAEGSLIRGGANFGLGALVGRAAPFAFTPAAAYLIQREIREGIRQYQEDLRQGMQGGLQGTAAVRETLGANIQARIEGINPFDALTTQMAKQIAAGIQSEGFTGAIRAAWQDSVTDVVKSTGIDAGTALQLMSTSANQLGESADQFRQDMNLVENAAKNTSFSVTQLAQNMQQLQTAFVQRGGIQAAAPAANLANVLQNALGNTQLGRAALSGITGVFAQPQVFQQAVAMAGINPLLANTDRVMAQAPRILDEYGARLWRIKNQGPGRALRLHDWVVMMYAAGLFSSLLPGADEATVEEFMRITQRGGLERTQREHLAENAPQPVHHHRGFFGSIIHGGLHAVTGGLHTAENAINYPAHLAQAGTAEILRDFGVPNNIAQLIGRGLTTTMRVPLSPIYNDNSVGATRQAQVQYWREQARSMGLNAAQTRQLLEPTQQAQSIGGLERANAQAQTIIVKLHPQAARYFTAEPGSVQAYYNSLNGSGGTQYMTRPPGG